MIDFKEVEEHDVSNSTWVARVEDQYRLRKMTHTFQIVVTSWATSMTTGPFTLNVYCGLNSAILTESTFDQT